RVFPSTACLLQDKLGIASCPAFDLQAVCSGFIYALATADSFIKSGAAKNVLGAGADAMAPTTDWGARSSCIRRGHGAGAVVLQAGEAPGIISSHLHADGSYANLLQVPSGVSQREGRDTIEMQGNPVFKIAVNTLDAIVDETL